MTSPRSSWGGNSGWAVVPYRFDDVVAALNATAPYDWAGFWKDKLDAHRPGSLLTNFEGTGYRFEWKDQMVPAEGDYLDKNGFVDAEASLGFLSGPKGELFDIALDSPGYRAGLGPADQLKTVNGQPYSAPVLRKALQAAKTDPNPIVLGTVREDEPIERKVDYHGGERFPWLVRVPGQPDLLQAITQPLPPPAAAKSTH